MPETFDEKFGKTIEDMQQYLIDNKMEKIVLSFTNGWHFSLSISSKNMEKQIQTRGKKQWS